MRNNAAAHTEQAMAREAIRAQDRLIVALDSPINPARRDEGINASDAEEILDSLGDLVRTVKVGWALFLREGPTVVDVIRKRGKRVFLDLKCGDIPETVSNLVAVAVDLGAEFLTVDTTIQAVRTAVNEAKGSDLRILTVTVLTSLDQSDLNEMGLEHLTVPQWALAKATRAKRVGCAGVICSGLEVEAIRKMAGDGFLIITPGIRPAGVAHDDHKRATTPEVAVRNGADYLVVGRPILKADSPRDAAQRILEEMQRAFDGR